MLTMIVMLTLYGFTDNSPYNSAVIAKPVVHEIATEDVGDYEHPITMASSSHFAFGTKFYIPRLQKYAVIEDRCGACERDTKTGKVRLDLFVGPSSLPIDRVALRKCQFALTSNQEPVIINPDAGLLVSETRLC